MLLCPVLMVIFDLLEEQMRMRVELRSALITSGALYVMTLGILLMLKLSAGS